MLESIGLIVSFIGFSLSAYLYKKKGDKQPLACPLKARCDLVLGSRFSKTLGIRNELLGMAYYAIVWVLYVAKMLVPEIATGGFLLFLAILCTDAILFSLYLTAVQKFVLKSWCSWCLFSALCNLVLFLLLFSLPTAALFAFLVTVHPLLVLLRTAGFIMGIGAVTIAKILFFRFLRDHKISEEEKQKLNVFMNIIWVGLVVLLGSGAALYLSGLDTPPLFLLSVLIIGVIVVSGFLLHFKVAPYLTQLSFDRTPAPTKLRRLAFALVTISLASWYTALFLTLFRSVSLNLGRGVLVYVVVLVCAVVASQIFERRIVRYEPLGPLV